jgi:hypothetical protein
MKLTIISTKGKLLTVEALDADSVLDFVEQMEERVWHFSLDDGKIETYVMRDQVVRVDIEHTDDA